MTRPERPTPPPSPTYPWPIPWSPWPPRWRCVGMHLCATLLPDRTVLVNGGAMMEESAADAVLEAEMLPSGRPGGPSSWAMAANLPGRPALPLGGPADA